MSSSHTAINARFRQHLPPPRPRTKPPGSTYKRCHCRDPLTGRWLDTTCPLLRWSNHGTWYFYVALPPVDGQRQRMRRGGFRTEGEAREAMQAELDQLGIAISATGSGPRAIDSIREYIAAAIAPRKAPGTHPRVRRAVRPRVRPLALIRRSTTLRAKDRP